MISGKLYKLADPNEVSYLVSSSIFTDILGVPKRLFYNDVFMFLDSKTDKGITHYEEIEFFEIRVILNGSQQYMRCYANKKNEFLKSFVEAI